MFQLRKSVFSSLSCTPKCEKGGKRGGKLTKKSAPEIFFSSIFLSFSSVNPSFTSFFQIFGKGGGTFTFFPEWHDVFFFKFSKVWLQKKVKIENSGWGHIVASLPTKNSLVYLTYITKWLIPRDPWLLLVVMRLCPGTSSIRPLVWEVSTLST